MSEYTSPMREDTSYTSILIKADELRETTFELLQRSLNRATEASDADWISFIRETAREAGAALSGDIRACSNVAHFFYDQCPYAIYSPHVAFSWFATGFAFTNENTWHAFSGMPGNSLSGVEDMFLYQMATMLLHIPEYQQLALQEMIWYIKKYMGHPYLGAYIKQLTTALCGISPFQPLRTPVFNLSALSNHALARQYYNLLASPDGYNQPDEMLASILGVPAAATAGSTASSGASSATSSGKPSGGCYIATCVYGSYDCPEVWTLRRFRDDVLRTSWAGRLFVRAYYAVSPTLVRWFGSVGAIRGAWKALLDPMVSLLQRLGLSSDRYEDR